MDEWSIQYLWRYTYLMERLVITAFALMLIHIAVVVTLFLTDATWLDQREGLILPVENLSAVGGS